MKNVLKAVSEPRARDGRGSALLTALELSAAGLVVAGALTLGIAYGFVSGLLEGDPDASGLTSNNEED